MTKNIVKATFGCVFVLHQIGETLSFTLSSKPWFKCVCFVSTFTHNMLEFGLSKKLCKDFLKKQAIIGNLNEGTIHSAP